MGEIWNILLINPITNILVACYKLFEWLKIPGPLGWAVILLTLLIRLVLYPLMNAQLKSAKKMADLKPQMDAISAKHKDDKQALQQAQLALYKEHGINPAAGCLPMLVQMPVLIALYNVFNTVLNNGNLEKVVTEINAIVYLPALKIASLDLGFLGTNLGVKPSEWQKYGWWLLLIPVITGGLQWWQTKLMQVQNPKSLPRRQAGEIRNPNPSASLRMNNQKDIEKKEEKKEDMMADMQKQMGLIMPIMFGWFALQFPLGLALYWNVFGIFGIMQQLRINKNN